RGAGGTGPLGRKPPRGGARAQHLSPDAPAHPSQRGMTKAGRGAGDGTRDAAVLRNVLAAAAQRGERMISALRIAFSAAVLVRFLTIEQPGVLPYLVDVP